MSARVANIDQLLRKIAQHTKAARDGNKLACPIEGHLRCIESLITVIRQENAQ